MPSSDGIRTSENDRVGRVDPQPLVRVNTVAGRLDVKSGQPQPTLERPADVAVVVDDQHSRSRHIHSFDRSDRRPVG
jgi:hypothetical protein